MALSDMLRDLQDRIGPVFRPISDGLDRFAPGQDPRRLIVAAIAGLGGLIGVIIITGFMISALTGPSRQEVLTRPSDELDAEVAAAVEAILAEERFALVRPAPYAVGGKLEQMHLSGWVASPNDRDEIERRLRDEAGAKNVSNELEVIPPALWADRLKRQPPQAP